MSDYEPRVGDRVRIRTDEECGGFSAAAAPQQGRFATVQLVGEESLTVRVDDGPIQRLIPNEVEPV